MDVQTIAMNTTMLQPNTSRRKSGLSQGTTTTTTTTTMMSTIAPHALTTTTTMMLMMLMMMTGPMRSGGNAPPIVFPRWGASQAPGARSRVQPVFKVLRFLANAPRGEVAKHSAGGEQLLSPEDLRASACSWFSQLQVPGRLCCIRVRHWGTSMVLGLQAGCL